MRRWSHHDLPPSLSSPEILESRCFVHPKKPPKKRKSGLVFFFKYWLLNDPCWILKRLSRCEKKHKYEQMFPIQINKTNFLSDVKQLIVKDEPCRVNHVSFALTNTHFRFRCLSLRITQHNPDDVIRVIWASISLSKAGEHWGHGVWKTMTLTRHEGSHKVELHGQKDAVFVESDLYLGLKSEHLSFCCSHVDLLKKLKIIKSQQLYVWNYTQICVFFLHQFIMNYLNVWLDLWIIQNGYDFLPLYCSYNDNFQSVS